jgi:hypothetical protein
MLGVVHPRRRRVGRTSFGEAQAYHPADSTPTDESELRSGVSAAEAVTEPDDGMALLRGAVAIRIAFDKPHVQP